MTLTSLTCSKCNVPLMFDPNTRLGYCPNCKTQYYMDDGVQRTEKIYRDEARLQEAYNTQESSRNAFSVSERTAKTKNVAVIAIIGVVLSLIVIIALILGLRVAGDGISKALGDKKIDKDEYLGKNYEEAERKLENRGFENVKTKPGEKNFLKKNKVSAILVDGESEFDSDDRFSTDVEIVLEYYE